MTKKICIQSGHWGKAGAGAPEEREGNKRIVDRLCAVLRARGYEVYQTDYYAYNDPVVTKTDWDLFLSCHMDMDYPDDGGSGFADYPEPSTDSATAESQRICKIINETYFPEVKINYVNRSNANTRFYYMWKHLTPPTPCVLIEMGQSIDPHDSVLLGNTDLIANALLKCILIAFNVQEEPQVSEEDRILKFLREQNANEGKVREAFGALADLEKLNKENLTLKNLSDDLASKVKELAEQLAEEQQLGASWQKELSSANKKIQKLEGEMTTIAKERNQYKNWYEAKCAELKVLDKMTALEHIAYGLKLLVQKQK